MHHILIYGVHSLNNDVLNIVLASTTRYNWSVQYIALIGFNVLYPQFHMLAGFNFFFFCFLYFHLRCRYVAEFSRSLYVEYKSKGIDVQCQVYIVLLFKFLENNFFMYCWWFDERFHLFASQNGDD